jgi:hypothetical protein
MERCKEQKHTAYGSVCSYSVRMHTGMGLIMAFLSNKCEMMNSRTLQWEGTWKDSFNLAAGLKQGTELEAGHMRRRECTSQQNKNRFLYLHHDFSHQLPTLLLLMLINGHRELETCAVS